MRTIRFLAVLAAALLLPSVFAASATPEPVKPPTPLTPLPGTVGEKEKSATPADTKAATTDEAKPAPPAKTLYVRLGGVAKIAAIGEDFADRLSKNTKLAANEKASKGLAELSKPALRFFATALLCQICRGPEVYTGKPIHELYLDLKLTDDEWKSMQSDLEQAFDDAKVAADEKKDMLAAMTEIHTQLAGVVLRAFNEKGVFAVLPGGWERIKSEDPNTLVAMQGPASEKDKNGTRPSVRILVEEFKAGLDMTAKEYMKANQLQMSKSLTNMKVLQSQSMALNNEPLEALACSFTNGDKEVSVETFFYVKNKHAYTIQFMGSKDGFEQYRAVFSDVLHTLRIE